LKTAVEEHNPMTEFSLSAGPMRASAHMWQV
jgi:hypothetical protein